VNFGSVAAAVVARNRDDEGDVMRVRERVVGRQLERLDALATAGRNDILGGVGSSRMQCEAKSTAEKSKVDSFRLFPIRPRSDL
jgi:uncharacterized membrane protein